MKPNADHWLTEASFAINTVIVGLNALVGFAATVAFAVNNCWWLAIGAMAWTLFAFGAVKFIAWALVTRDQDRSVLEELLHEMRTNNTGHGVGEGVTK